MDTSHLDAWYPRREVFATLQIAPEQQRSMSTLFLPLRSNCGWFTSEDTHAQLGYRLKNWLLFYDEIAPENGRYRATYGYRGSFDMVFPGDTVEDRGSITYHKPGAEFAIRVAREPDGDFHPVLGGETVASYEVDFFPLLAEAGITSADYVRWVDVELTEDGKSFAKRSASEALRLHDSGIGLPENHWLRQKIVQNLHQDALLASALELPLSVDVHASVVLERSNAVASARWSTEATSVLQESWLSLGLPDAGLETWDVVLEARESAAGRDLRRMISRLSEVAAEALVGGVSAPEFAEEARRLLVHELVSELLKRRSTAGQAVVNLGLNLIPYASVALGSANDVRRVVQEHRSWVTLLGKLQSGQSPATE